MRTITKIGWMISSARSNSLETALAEFIRGYVDYALTPDRDHLPDFLKDGQDNPAVGDVKGMAGFLGRALITAWGLGAITVVILTFRSDGQSYDYLGKS